MTADPESSPRLFAIFLLFSFLRDIFWVLGSLEVQYNLAMLLNNPLRQKPANPAKPVPPTLLLDIFSMD